jgi:flagellar basal-body rod modification protein FlgD
LQQALAARETGGRPDVAWQLLNSTHCFGRHCAGSIRRKTCFLVLWCFEKLREDIVMTQITSAGDIQADYMKLLVTQLQNQNPLEPLDNNEMASQLAQFSQLQQLESLNSNFARVLAATELTYANSLIGKEVSFVSQTEAGTTEIATGIVEQVISNADDEILLVASDQTFALADVVSVKN